MINKKYILFFIVHPSKYHLFKKTINALIDEGHDVDIFITSKDILEDLIKAEGWKYKNIFPEGRKLRNLPIMVGAGINLLRTLYRLYKHIGKSKYDLFVTDDCLSVIGKIKKTTTVNFVDDDLSIVSESKWLLYFSDYIIAPNCTSLGILENKKIGFEGFKQSAYLRKEHFRPDYNIVKKFNSNERNYFIIRLVLLESTHDIGKKGITNDILDILIQKLELYGKVFISSERKLPNKYINYVLNIKPIDMIHALYFADMLICDSQSMALEAGAMGTPFIRFNDFVGRISVLEKMEKKYGLGYGIRRSDINGLYDKITEIIEINKDKSVWANKRDAMLATTIDLSALMTDLFSNCDTKLIKP